MPHRRLVSIQDCEDFVRGCTILGTGGGGSAEEGLRLLSAALGGGLSIEWIDPFGVADDAWTATAYLVGSIAPASADTEAEIARLDLVEQVDLGKAMSIAIREMETYTGQEIQAIVPVELGGSNTPGPLVSSLSLGIPVVDGDYTGRATPEAVHLTPSLFGKAAWPLALVDRWGNVCILKDAPKVATMERVCKMLAVAAYGLCAVCGMSFCGREMKQLIVPGTLTKALELGRAIRMAREEGKDPVQAATQFLQGWVLFKGQVTRKDWEDRGGYMYGTTHLQGFDEFDGHTFRVWFKNENHIAWKDDEPFVTSPDLICLVDAATAEPMTNTLIMSGDRVVVIGARAAEPYRTAAGVKVLGPAHFGFEIDYVPIERAVCFS